MAFASASGSGSRSGTPDLTPALHQAHKNIIELQDSIASFSSAQLGFSAPVIDREHPEAWRSDEVKGLKKFVESVDALSVLLAATIAKGSTPRDDPLPNVSAHITAWKQVVLAERPIAGVRLNLQGRPVHVTGNGNEKVDPKGKKRAEGFVDVIAQGGNEWIRLYTKKTNQLMAELREQDSYCNSDYDTDSDDPENVNGGPSARPQLRNSLLTTADSLVELSDLTERIPGAKRPSLTLRVTRIPETATDHPDIRITESLEQIRQKGVKVVFGDLSDIPLHELPSRTTHSSAPLRPSLSLCLDPTALMALCSDLLHHPLPTSEEEARSRFYRPKETLRGVTQAGRNGTSSNGQNGQQDDDEAFGQSQNSRELVKNILEEMNKPLIPEIRDILAEVIAQEGTQGSIELWTTKEAVQYIKETLGSEEVVGDGMEQMRMRRLLGLEEGDFFQGSRYQGEEGVLHGRLRLHVFDGDGPADNGSSRKESGRTSATPFHQSLHAVATSCLDDYNAWTLDPANKETTAALPNFLKPQRLPIPKVATLSLPFPIVSLITLARGAQEGMTTLMMGNIILRDLFSQPRWKIKGWTHSSYPTGAGLNAENEPEHELNYNAAVWMLPYRSLGEGKRVKFAKGDFSYPGKGR